jgi:hypothetical protein
MSKDFYMKKRARFLATKDAFLAKNKSKVKKDLDEGTKIVIRRGWRTLVKRPEKLLK